MKPRIKKSLAPALTTRDDAEARVHDFAVAANQRATLVAEMDARILEIKNQFQDQIAAADAQMKAAADDLEAWAIANPAEFAGKKSIEFLDGFLRFRTGTPKLALLNRQWNWDSVTAAVARLLPNFVRNKPEVDKEAILGQRDELAEYLPGVGLKVVQDEGFTVEAKLHAPEVAP